MTGIPDDAPPLARIVVLELVGREPGGEGDVAELASLVEGLAERGAESLLSV